MSNTPARVNQLSTASCIHSLTCFRFDWLAKLVQDGFAFNINPMVSTRATWALCVVFVALVLVTVAHLHPGSGFTLPVLPSGRLFEPVYVHERFQPENLQLDHQQCEDAYPLLYHEADRARRWYTSRSGITEKMVDAAEKEHGHARLAIINNNVRATQSI